MWLADGWKDYQVIDCSKGEKLERWGEYLLVRPDPQVIWDTPKLMWDGVTKTDIITEAQKGAANGNFLICLSSGPFLIKTLPST